MEENKKSNRTADTSIQVRLSKKLKNDFDTFCRMNSINKSDLLRNLIIKVLNDNYY